MSPRDSPAVPSSRRFRITPASLCVTLLLAVGCRSAPDRTLGVYYASWGRMPVDSLPVEKLTHVYYAFAVVSEDGRAVLADSEGALGTPQAPGKLAQLRGLEARNPDLEILLSIGGWADSGRFSDLALTAEGRARFASSAITLLDDHGFDGLDIDWEYPSGGGLEGNVERPEDATNCTLLLKELREGLDALGQSRGVHYLLTVASAAGGQVEGYDLAGMTPYLDWFNVMTYDYHGGWDATSNHHTALQDNPADPGPDSANIGWTIDYYLDHGVPARKLVLGCALYSRSWGGVGADDGGLFKPSTQQARGGDYHSMYRRLNEHPDDYVELWDEYAKVSYIHSSTVAGGSFYTYDGVRSIRAKLEFATERGLSGVMFWEASGDLPIDHDDSILRLAWDSWVRGQTE